MIQVTFKRRNQEFVAFEMTGHAAYAESGQDIVCAGVSALAITTVNSIEKLAGFEPICEVDEVEGGYLYLELLSELTEKQAEVSNILLQNLFLGLQGIQSEYPDYLEILVA